MRTLSLLLFLTLAAVIVPSPGAATTAPLPAWIEERLLAAGVDPAASDLRVMRTVYEDGVPTTFELPLSALARDDPLGQAPAVASPAVPAAVVGELTHHAMLQSVCTGYRAVAVGARLTAIADATWPLGVHAYLGPLGGGLAAGTEMDGPEDLAGVVGIDTGISDAVGAMTITETRVVIFGRCLLLIGEMSGTGAWVFS